MEFTYLAVGPTGAEISGKISATSQGEAELKVKAKGIFPTHMKLVPLTDTMDVETGVPVDSNGVPDIADLTEAVEGTRKAIADAERMIMGQKNKLTHLQILCRKAGHTVTDKPHPEASSLNGATCSICGDWVGWYCDDGPEHVCDYQQDDGSYNPTSCVYCGKAETRR